MVDRIGQGGSSLARAAIEAALARQSDAARKASALSMPVATEAAAARPADFARALDDGLRAVDAEVARADRLAGEVVSGQVVDFHEAAAVLKQSELSLKFALEVRNTGHKPNAPPRATWPEAKRPGAKKSGSNALTGSPRSICATPSPIDGASLKPWPLKPLTTNSPSIPSGPIKACASGESVYSAASAPASSRPR